VFARPFIAVTVAALAACASGGASAGAKAPNTPPRIVNRTRPPELYVGSADVGHMVQRSRARLDLRVEVDSLGQPDMNTFVVTGFAAAENRDALARWIRESVFEPARKNGHPVRSTFHMTMSFRF
jgi:hypothetical protein